MIIDFHTHMFPDSLAEKTIQHLSQTSDFPNQTNGTMQGTIENMEKSGVDLSVVCNIATNAKQTENVNKFAVEIDKNPKLISFGSVHPDCDWSYFLDWLKENQIKGIKLHPDYQGFFVDEPRMQKIYEAILKRGLVLIFHTGFDDGIGEPVHASPRRLKSILPMFRGEKVVFAHMGGFRRWEGVCEHLLGEDVFFDTSCSAEFMGFSQFEKMIRIHTPEKVLFATDLPWTNPEQEIRKIQSLCISQEEKEKILGENARQLLGL